MYLDALGLAYLTGNLDGLAHLGGRSVVSPNVKELFTTLEQNAPAELQSEAGIKELRAAVSDLAKRAEVVVVSGADTSFVAAPDGRAWRDETGGQGLAISGSGDVKAGIIVGLLARGADPVQAAVWAKYVHGRCGERLTSHFGPRGFLARDLLTHIPQVIAELEY